MLTSTLLLSLLLTADIADPAGDVDERQGNPPTKVTVRQLVTPRRPVRKDEPLREINISDIEVSEIEAIMKERYPASIVYISPVTTGCPCEEGATCTDQVWSIAQQADRSHELSLSRIDEQWQVGPLQEWWLVRDQILLEMRRWRAQRADQQENQQRLETYREYLERLEQHRQTYPVCTTD